VQARDIVDELLERIRSMSFDLRPAALDELGLLPALLALLESYTQRTGVVVNFRHQGLEGRFEPEVESAAYRIVQEALTNVARHAGVGDVTVRAWSSADTLGLRVEDRGRGFDPKVTSVTSKSAGLSGMRERVLLLDGRLAIESGPSMGTQITAELPIGGGKEGANDANLDRARG
jgi:signal transduction histidine kinase